MDVRDFYNGRHLKILSLHKDSRSLLFFQKRKSTFIKIITGICVSVGN